MTKIIIYAPGNGSLDFVRVDHAGKACEPHKITMTEANQVITDREVQGYDYSAFKLVDNHGAPLLIPDVTRNRETGIISYDNHVFTRINGAWFAGEANCKEWHLLKNVSMHAALRFFEENPKFYGM